MRPFLTRRILSSLAVLLLASGCLHAAGQYLFRHYDTEDGLVGNSITCMAQDRLGILWFGTRNGVCWFDGSRFNTLADKDPDRILSSRTISLCIGQDGLVWISSLKGLCSYNPETGYLWTAKMEQEVPVRNLVCDQNGFMWFVQSDAICRMDPRTHETRIFQAADYFSPVSAYRGEDGCPWFCARDGNLYRYSPESDAFEAFRILPNRSLAKGVYPTFISPLGDGEFLLATSDNHILQVNPGRGSAQILLSEDQMEPEAAVLCLLENRQGEYLVGSNKGLYIIRDHGKSVTMLGSDPRDRFSLSSDNIRTLFKDRDGGIWAGTFYSGVNRWLQSDVVFYRNFSDTDPASIHGNTVRSICLDEEENIWIGTEDGYLNRIHPDGSVLPVGPENGLPPLANYHALLLHEGKLVIGTYDNGIFLFDPQRMQVLRHSTIPNDSPCICLLGTRDGTVLAGTGRGLYVYEPDTGGFEKVDAFGSLFVHALREDSKGRIWIGTYGSGAWIWDRQTDNCTILPVTPGDNSLENLYVTYLFEDRSGAVWMATEGNGICVARPDEARSGSFRTAQYTLEPDGLPSNISCGIVQTSDGMLWVSTDKGVFSLDPASGRLQGSYIDQNNTIGNYFRYGSVMKASDDRIYLGTTLGMVSFRPASVQNARSPELLVTEILAGSGDKTLSLSEPGRSVMTSERIRVRHRDAAFLSFRFSDMAADPWHPRKYRCRLSRTRKESSSITEGNSVIFSGIRPGKYRFELSPADSETASTPRRLDIVVTPPFYASAIARLFYLLAAGGLAWLFFRHLNQRRANAREQYLRRLESEKEHEIYDAKINFFTNIAHEIRTPLTLIKMPVEKIVTGGMYTEETREDMLTIQANTERLLSLTNQLLDFRKIENKQLQLNFMPEDLCELVRRVCDYFTLAAEENHITFRTDIPQEKMTVMCAANSIEKVVSNLISNGLKYSLSRVDLTLRESADGASAVITVTSDGEKISLQHREKIFEPFFQERSSQIKVMGSKGTGLGLPFARMLTELHNGRLYLDDTDQPGNSFVLILPKQQATPFSLTLPASPEESAPEAVAEEEKAPINRHTVLIAEDDRELNEYLRKELSADYAVLQAFNGDKALEIIKSAKVDILVSDIMMPGIDGCTLCNIVKTNLEYSHIPVLLLTAAVGMERHIETLQVGADGYLEKPFSIDLLKANIQNLFNNRELTFKQFTDSPLSHFNGLKVGNMDDEYMNRLHKEVMKRLADPDLNIEALTSALGTSKSTLFRKVKANTGLNINEYIKLCRLKKAAELLAGQKHKINEVGLLVGFTSPSYFTANFKKQFNVSPSDFVRQIKGKRSD